MNSLMCLLIPALVGIKFYEHLRKNNLTYKDFIIYYFILVLLINIISVIFSIIFFKLNGSIELSLSCYPLFAVKYVSISLFFSFLIPICLEIIRKNISVDIGVKINEKKEK